MAHQTRENHNTSFPSVQPASFPSRDPVICRQSVTFFTCLEQALQCYPKDGITAAAMGVVSLTVCLRSDIQLLRDGNIRWDWRFVMAKGDSNLYGEECNCLALLSAFANSLMTPAPTMR